MRSELLRRFCLTGLVVAALIGWPGYAKADLTFNVLAVNGTDEEKERDIEFYLPRELQSSDIYDTAGFKIEYDAIKGAYKVSGKVTLGAKESRTIKIRIRDVWVIEVDEVDELREQIDLGLESIADTEFYEDGEAKKETLNQRLTYILEEQDRFSDNVEQRIDRYRVYAKELEQIRNKAQSIKFWRSQTVEAEEPDLFNLILTAENPSQDRAVTQEQKHFLPPEVKPEHIVNSAGFAVRYDIQSGQSYLSKTEELQPGEIKRYEVGILDVWNIPQNEIDNLKDRTRVAYAALERSKYAPNAAALVDSIKTKLDALEESQEEDRDIKEHINAYRVNKETFEQARNDVSALEQLLEAIKEQLERSILKNVLQKIQQLKSIWDIAKAIFKKRPKFDKILKLIIGIVIFVGVLTAVHFIIWGRRSREAKLREIEEKETEDNEQQKE